MLGAHAEEHQLKTTIERHLLECLAVLSWREIRLARAEAFETKANRSNLEYEEQMEKQLGVGALRNRRPKYYRTLAHVLPIETQLIVGRYQTMLSNQITQALRQLREEQSLRQQTIEVISSKDCRWSARR